MGITGVVPPLGGRTVELRPNLEGWMLLGGMAAVTTRLELGALVSGNTYRNPAPLAKMAVTLDEVSKGRAILGIGAGWHAREHEAYGWDFPSLRERSDRLEEACQLIRMLFHAGPQELVNYEGKYYRLTEAPFVPNHYRGAGPRGRKRQDAIPIMVGGKGRKRTLKTLARYGDIMNVISSPEEFKQECDVLDRHCEAVGRDPAEISRTVHIPLRIMDDEQNAKELRAGTVRGSVQATGSTTSNPARRAAAHWRWSKDTRPVTPWLSAAATCSRSMVRVPMVVLAVPERRSASSCTSRPLFLFGMKADRARRRSGTMPELTCQPSLPIN